MIILGVMKRFLSLILAFFLMAAFAMAETPFSVSVTPEIAWQGKVLEIKVPLAGIKDIRAEFLGQKFKLYPDGDVFVGIVGVPTNQKVGHYDLRLIITQTDGKIVEQTKNIKVWQTKFLATRYTLKPSRDKLRSPKIINNEWGKIEKVLVKKGSKRLWQGKFAYPCQARISQGFGHLQIINGKRSGTHRGLDLAVPIGTKVFAPNSGKVVFADKLKAFGGTMVLDHGHGIHTLYFHLSKFAAEVGAMVTKGTVIAYSGNSGVSSGAHLHWGMSVQNLRVDPEQWVKYEL
ncbi:MAG: M23 family metallopeptidase [bacterium]